MDNSGLIRELAVSCNTDSLDLRDPGLFVPTDEQMSEWANRAIQLARSANSRSDSLELSIALVDAEAMQALNKQYRDNDKPTNVLSFSAEDALLDPNLVGVGLLGDVVICPQIVSDEALVQGKPVEHHFAHLLVHGVLHLLGMDHHVENAALAMETAEIQILSSLGIPNPYNSVFTKPT